MNMVKPLYFNNLGPMCSKKERVVYSINNNNNNKVNSLSTIWFSKMDRVVCSINSDNKLVNYFDNLGPKCSQRQSVNCNNNIIKPCSFTNLGLKCGKRELNEII